MKFVDHLLEKTGLKSNPDAHTTERRTVDLPPPLARAAAFRVAAGRETVEAFVVAFILALLFRAFLAEVFVIPTGSMAPTLMGAHKDLFCNQCECRFQVGASQERVIGSGAKVVVGAVCPNCRRLNSLDLVGDSDQKTFNGDRIVVNKYAYALGEPERWDVIVFKFPGNPKQNYIKRLVGLPNETITIDHGNVYAQPSDRAAAEQAQIAEQAQTADLKKPVILRKPADKMVAMSHLIYDTDFQSPTLVDAGFPSRWQPWAPAAEQPPNDGWTIERSDRNFVAKLDATDTPKWIRYFHRWPNEAQWQTAIENGSLANVDPYQSRAVTDFYAYNSSVDVPGYEVYQDGRVPAESRSRSRIGSLIQWAKQWTRSLNSSQFDPSYQSGGPMTQFNNSNLDLTDDFAAHGIRDGMHWIGELMVTADIEFGSGDQNRRGDASDPSDAKLVLEIVKAGVQYQCVVDLTNGDAKLQIVEDENIIHWATKAPSAATDLTFGSSAKIRLANYDHMMRLWIDDEEIVFDKSTQYDETAWRSRKDDRPHWTERHPLDAAPVGLSVVGCQSSIGQLRIDRDQYYVATRNRTIEGNTEYDTSEVWRWSTGNFRHEIADRMGQPRLWDQSQFWDARQTQTYVMQAEQFFPLGDNSPGSLDARSWAGSKAKLPLPRDVIEDAWRWHDVHYVPKDLMVGKAVFVLWPHPWTKPFVVTPDFGQIEMIR